MSVNSGPYIVTSGLVMDLDPANPRSYPGTGNVWTDVGGLGNSGTLVNGVTFETNNLGTFYFDGVDDYAEYDLGNVLVRDFTLEYWMKSAATVEGRGVISYGGSTYGFIAAYRLKPNSSSWYFSTTSGTIAPPLSYNLTDNNWYQIVMSYDGTNSNVYVNTTLEINATNATGNLRNTSDKKIRVAIWTGTVFQDVTMGDIRIYDKALSTEEIEQNFNALRGRYGI